MPSLKIALLGLGTMGSGMATSLIKAGYPLAVYNRTRAKAESLRAKGAHVADSPTAAAEGAQLIFSMLADDDASREAWLGAQGALPACSPGVVLVECSTVSVAWVHELARRAAKQGCSLLDAPVTGSRAQAAAGELLFLVGGPADALEIARPVLRAMGRDVLHLGPIGSGAQVKLVNNFLCGVQAASLAEALAWIEHSGLDRRKALDVLVHGAPGSPLIRALAERMVNRDYHVNFLLRLMAKDLTYAAHQATESSITLETGPAASRVFQQAIARGDGEKDLSAVVEQFRDI